MNYFSRGLLLDVMLSKCGDFSVLAPRFNGRNCGFPATTQTLNHLDSIMPLPATPGGVGQEQTRFEELRRQCGLTAPLQWESAVENYIILKNMAGL